MQCKSDPNKRAAMFVSHPSSRSGKTFRSRVEKQRKHRTLQKESQLLLAFNCRSIRYRMDTKH